MFESARLPHTLDKETFATLSDGLREKLLNAQFELAEKKNRCILVLINGSDGAGKGEVLNRLYDWLDDHLVETLSYEQRTDEERARPPAWRYWRDMPGKGRIGLVLGSWYHGVLRARATGRIDDNAFRQMLEDINRAELMLHNEGVLVVKLWLFVEEAEARRRLDELRAGNGGQKKATVIEWRDLEGRKAREQLNQYATEMIETTSTGYAPWAVVPAADGRYRDAAVGDLLLHLLERATADEAPPTVEPRGRAAPSKSSLPRPSIVSGLDLSQTADPDAYRKELRAMQRRLSELTTEKRFRDRGLILVLEGNDAAGKGGAIQRVREALDPRRFRVHGVAAPTDEELARPYLWRFWRRVPRRGDIAIFDRSWYGRVLVERVEGLCSEDAWMRAYQEINDFERELGQAGYVIVKFWLAISPDEQLARFHDREAKPFKRYKLTPEDWRNREKWPLYEEAVTDMVDRTSSALAPWTLVAANDKKFARLKILRGLVERLEE